MTSVATRKTKNTQHPVATPALLCLSERVGGAPIILERLLFAADSPIARFHENDKPGGRRPGLRTRCPMPAGALRSAKNGPM